MKTLLLPTDFSEVADNAVTHAIEIAKMHGSKIIFLHSLVQDYTTFLYSLAVSANEAFKKEAEERMKLLCSRVETIGVKCEALFSDETLTSAVLKAALERNVDCIIVGTRGANGLKKVLVGSNTSVFVEKARCPVLVIPQGAKYKKIKEICYGTDYHEKDSEVLASLVKFAKPFGAKINAVHFAEEVSDRELTKMDGFITKQRSRLKYAQLFGEVIQKKFGNMIDPYLKTSNCNMFSMSTQQRYALQKLLVESKTKELSYQSSVPLLVYHHAQKPILL